MPEGEQLRLATRPTVRKKIFPGRAHLAPSQHSKIGHLRQFRVAAPVLVGRLKRAVKQYGAPVAEQKNRDFVTRAIKRRCVLTCSERVLSKEETSCRITVKVNQTVLADVIVTKYTGSDQVSYAYTTWRPGRWQRYISAYFPDLHPGSGLGRA